MEKEIKMSYSEYENMVDAVKGSEAEVERLLKMLEEQKKMTEETLKKSGVKWIKWVSVLSKIQYKSPYGRQYHNGKYISYPVVIGDEEAIGELNDGSNELLREIENLKTSSDGYKKSYIALSSKYSALMSYISDLPTRIRKRFKEFLN
jgi:hypothetical protein